MTHGTTKFWALAALVITTSAVAQQMPDIGFKSVGRGRPLAASVLEQKEVGPSWIRPPGDQRRGSTEGLTLNGFTANAPPKGVKPLPKDIFTSTDFYADKDLWNDPRYFRCNSPMGTEVQRGILAPPGVNVSGNIPDGPWGHCELDYPREAIVSPYTFTTAQEHYEALLAETTKRGGPNVYTSKDFPADEWNGSYEAPRDGNNQMNWYWGRHSQISTILSVLTPEYRQRMVQEAYHQVRGNAIWPSTFCWPEGFMRRWYPAAVRDHFVIATPKLVQVNTGVADNFVQSIHVGRKFNMEDVATGGVPRLGAAVPRWYGETIGFWDGDVLITWTSNVQAWKSHSQFEFSSKLQSVEIYTPIRGDGGKFVGLNHETIVYDADALAQPIRIVRNLHKTHDYTDAEETPYAFIECVQTIFSVDGHNAPLTPGAKIEYEMPDMYGRPWDAIWQKYFEQGMSRPEDNGDSLFKFD